MSAKNFNGTWEITEMEQWNVEPGWFIEFDDKGNGSFHFICVNAEINYRTDSNKKTSVEFTFHGDDEGEDIFGRGWAEVDGAELCGYLHFHQGDGSGFKAKMLKIRK